MVISSILVASDLTRGTENVVAAAVDLAAQTQSKLIGLHVLTEEELKDYRVELPSDSSHVDTIAQLLRSNLEEQFSSKGMSLSKAVDLRVEEGDPAELIGRVAGEESVDLIVIGVRNRSRVGKLLLGSTSQSVLLSAPCSVLAVPLGHT